MCFLVLNCIKYGVQFCWQDVLFLQLTDVLFLQLTKSLQQFRWGNAPCYNAFSVLKTSARHGDILSRGLWMCFRKFLHFLCLRLCTKSSMYVYMCIVWQRLWNCSPHSPWTCEVKVSEEPYSSRNVHSFKWFWNFPVTKALHKKGALVIYAVYLYQMPWGCWLHNWSPLKMPVDSCN